MECVPMAKDAVLSCTTSLLEMGTVPRVAEPSKKVTVPVAKSPLTDGTTVAMERYALFDLRTMDSRWH